MAPIEREVLLQGRMNTYRDQVFLGFNNHTETIASARRLLHLRHHACRPLQMPDILHGSP